MEYHLPPPSLLPTQLATTGIFAGVSCCQNDKPPLLPTRHSRHFSEHTEAGVYFQFWFIPVYFFSILKVLVNLLVNKRGKFVRIKYFPRVDNVELTLGGVEGSDFVSISLQESFFEDTTSAVGPPFLSLFHQDKTNVFTILVFTHFVLKSRPGIKWYMIYSLMLNSHSGLSVCRWAFLWKDSWSDGQTD